ncbi:GNAT family N-acetyltransferase [Herbaspirillum sp.]|uniref:GNAT family N-acetyltransferase n=1 Tax=Herbaspirillum sp. TaxID=1890675 RepID=UPI001B268636|nr:GNAT family N-acetyltransferase [Herbaspirillum sp.]MBO9536067.1 GNAT family N-acetyltransferase [Herbaspirillum sp.]
MAAARLQLQVIHHFEELAALASEWDALEQKLYLRTPFTSSAWNLLWWRHHRESKMTIQDELYSFALRNDRGELVAVAPMMVSLRPGIKALGIRVLQFFGADPNITEIRGPICDPEYRELVVATLQNYLHTCRRKWDWIEWQGLSLPQALILATPSAAQPMPRVVCYLTLPPTWEELKTSLSRNMKEAIRKCFNSLKRDRHSHEMHVVSKPDEVHAAMQTFFDLHTLRATTGNTVEHPNVFRHEKSRRFLTEFAHKMAQHDRLRLFQVKIQGKVVATRIGFVCGRHLYLYYSGYDVEWGKYSIMTTVVVHAVQWAIANGFEYLNLSTGRDYSKMRWQPNEYLLHNAIQISPRLRSAPLFHGYHKIRSGAFSRFMARRG